MLRTMRLSMAAATVGAALVFAAGAGAAAWQPAAPLNLSNGSDPAVGMDGVGNTVATWQTNPPTPHVIQGARHLFGGIGFQQLPDVASDPILDNTDTVVRVNRAGQGFVAWVHGNGVNQQVQMKPIVPGGIIGAEQDVSPVGGNYGHLAGAINGNGDAVIAWQHNSNNVEAITRQGLGGAFTSPQLLDSAGVNAPSVAIDASGNAMAVWPTSALVGALFTKRHPAGGSWSASSASFFHAGDVYTDQTVSSNPNGQVVVAFLDSVGPTIDEVSGTVSGGFGAPSTPGTVISPPGVAHGPGVNVDDAGGATVGWTTATSVQYSSRPNGASFPPPGGVQSISPVPVMPAKFELAGNGRGDVIATWDANEAPSNNNVVRAAVKPAGSTSFGASQVISDQTRVTDDATIALDENGDAVVGMSLSSLGMPAGVEAAIYDASPPLLGALSGPTRLARGARGSFSSTASDGFSGVTLSWSFGDGSAAATGSSVSHTFGRTGTFTVRVTATDTAGNSTAKQTSVTVTTPPPPPNCRVPRLKGKTLSQAKTLLGRAHCKLGRVHKPRKPKHRKLRKLVVASSSPGAGKVRPNGTKVALTLKEAPKPKPKPKHKH